MTKRDKGNWTRLCTKLGWDRAQLRCEICHHLPDWRGLSGAHCIRRARGIKSAPDVAWNVLIACGRCHNHTIFPVTGLPLTEEEALKLAKDRNEKYGIDPMYDGSVE